MPHVPASRVRSMRWIAVALWAAVIFVLSSVPSSKIQVGVGGYGHFAEYAVLGGLLVFALTDTSRVLAAVALASAYGVTDELHQLLVPGRMADPVDWAVDTAGAVVGAVVIAWLMRRSARRAARPARQAGR